MSEGTSDIIPQRLRWSGMTHLGKVRTNNEDVFLALNFDAHEVRFMGKTGEASLSECDYVFAVSDGMGGAKSGEFASRIAVEKITRLLPRSFRYSAQQMDVGFSDVLMELFHRIHNDLIKMGQAYEECAGMGATLSLGWFRPGWMFFGHIGDSRIYYLPRDGGITQVTHDHTYVGWMKRQGSMNERQIRMHPQRNVLTQALGAGHQFLNPHFGAVSCHAGDRFVFCSDGVTDGLWDHHIEELARTAIGADAHDSIAQRIVEVSVEEAGNDNTTAVVVEIL